MFKFKNISDKEMNVVCEEIDNILTKASIISETNIDGENSELDYYEEGYSNVEGTLDLFVLDKSKIDSIKSWLNGKGLFEYKGRITNLAFYSEYEISRSSTIYKLSVDFVRSPFWYKSDDEFVSVENDILNEGNVHSYPIIRIEKGTSDSVDISINDVRFKYNFNGDEFVEIDCQKAQASYNNLSRNLNLEIGYLFPTINPGDNKVIINDGDAIIKVKRKDCWL